MSKSNMRLQEISGKKRLVTRKRRDIRTASHKAIRTTTIVYERVRKPPEAERMSGASRKKPRRISSNLTIMMHFALPLTFGVY